MNINVKGMHCNACTMLVKMELKDNGFKGKIDEVQLTKDNVGVVVLKNCDEDEVDKAKKIINAMESYEVI
jgi:hypothetical protein